MNRLPEARRMPGSEWLKNRPRLLAAVYILSKAVLGRIYPLLKRIRPAWRERTFILAEELTKGYIFNCQMCGQCILHSTGMTCPMNCPKNLRNGPCGGVRQDGNCEVIPDMPCVWVQAWQRDAEMERFGGEIRLLQPPLDRTLEQSSAWLNLLEGSNNRMPRGWAPIEPN